MKESIKTIGYLTLVICFVGLIIYGSWHLKRTLNYKWAYQSQIQSEIQKSIQPLNDRITRLELEVSQLKTNK